MGRIQGAIIDFGDWLQSLGLEQYETAFRENFVDEKVLPSLTSEDLKDLGIGFVVEISERPPQSAVFLFALFCCGA